MCGIVGAIGRDGAEVLAPMLRALAHRGPDDEATLVAGDVALGHRRLSILDLTPAGRQPMTTPDGRHAIVVNGEIYNHEALRAPLAAAGVAFRGRCDAET